MIGARALRIVAATLPVVLLVGCAGLIGIGDLTPPTATDGDADTGLDAIDQGDQDDVGSSDSSSKDALSTDSGVPESGVDAGPPFDSGCGPIKTLPDPQCNGGTPVQCEQYLNGQWSMLCKANAGACTGSNSGAVVECLTKAQCSGKACCYQGSVSGSNCSTMINTFVGSTCASTCGSGEAVCTSDNDCSGNTHCLPVTLASPAVVPFGLCL